MMFGEPYSETVVLRDSTDSGNESIPGLLHILPVSREALQKALFHQGPADIDDHPHQVGDETGKGIRGPIAEEGQKEIEELEGRGRVTHNRIRSLGLYLLVA